MPSAATAVPRSTRLTSLRSRREDVAADVRRREEAVERLRSELALPPANPPTRPGRRPAERAMISAVRELVAARARLAQISRELQVAQG